MILRHNIHGSITIHNEYISGGQAALSYLSTHHEVDPPSTFVIGASPSPIAGMVSVAGVSKPIIDAMIAQSKHHQYHFPKPENDFQQDLQPLEEISPLLYTGQAAFTKPDPAKKLLLPTPMSYFIDDFAHDPINIARSLTMPLLFVQGKTDWQVTVDHFGKGWAGLLDQLAGHEAAIRLLAG
jgi:hypothetical protein